MRRTPAAEAGRTVGDLEARARELEEERLELHRIAQDRAAVERERKAAQAREKELDRLVGKEEALWSEVDKLVGLRQPGKYDAALRALLNLRELAKRAGTETDFSRRVAALAETHERKRAFIERLKDAGMLDG